MCFQLVLKDLTSPTVFSKLDSIATIKLKLIMRYFLNQNYYS